MYQVLYNLEQMLVSKSPIQLSLLMELCSLKRSEVSVRGRRWATRKDQNMLVLGGISYCVVPRNVAN